MSLEWEPEESHHDDGGNYVAHLPWRRSEFLSSPYYRVYPWKDGWAYNRSEHPDLDKLNGWAQTLEAAKEACDQDFVVVARLHRWQLHMINQEPPS